MTGKQDAASVVDTFEAEQPWPFGLAYSLLGVRADAEDAVQDAWLRFSAQDVGSIDSIPAFLTTVVTRLCLDRLKSARAVRESYTGPWLPEPIQTGPGPEAMAVDREMVSLAMLMLLERLSEAERAVFVLHESLGYRHLEIAEVLGCSDAASRQHLHRARRKLGQGRHREAPPEERRKATEAFITAATTGNLAPFLAIVREDAVLVSDGGGKAFAATRPLHGRDRILKFFIGAQEREGFDRLELREANGGPVCLFWLDNRLTTVLWFELEGGEIDGIRAVRNPDKLARWDRPVRLE